jgi:asparagine synthase (glutamine-hydrolysing)
MRLIGGVVFWDPARPVADALLHAMAGRVPGTGEPVCTVRGAAGFFSCLGPDTLAAESRTQAAGDLDLTNGQEVESLAGRNGERGSQLTRLYEALGPAFVGRLRGAFAVAVWDRRFHRLLLAVDRFGIKRLYYAATADGLGFASTPSALLAVPGVGGDVDPDAVYEYLNFGCVPAPRSIFKGIRRLPPAHTLVVGGGAPVVAPYWRLGYREQPIRLRDAAEATFRMVEQAVAESVGGTGAKETGAFLSGGTDSSTVVGLMGRVTGEPVRAFSIGFREARYDELQYAEGAARHFGAVHETATFTADDAMAVLPGVVAAYHEPLGNDSTLGTYACARLARDHGMTRLLAGDGGDELFGGNERYRIHQIFAAYSRIPRPLRKGVVEPALSWLPDGRRSPLGRAQRYVRRANLSTPRRFYSYSFFFAQEGAGLLTPEFARVIDLEAPWRTVQRHYADVAADSDLNRLLHVDLKLTIGDNDLLKVVQTAELAGIGVRFPMLDHRLAEFTGTWPARYKVFGLQKRYLFKRAFRQLLPDAVLKKRKHGFGVPVAEWLRSHPGFRDLMRDTLGSPNARVRAHVGGAGLARLTELHATDTTSYYGTILWKLLMLELWYRQHAGAGVAWS